MRFKDDTTKPDATGRLPGEPHPDAQKNLEICVYRLKDFEKPSRCQIIYSDVDSNGIICDPIMVAFYWHEKGNRWGRPVSFHQGSFDFNKEIVHCLEWLEKRGMMKRIMKKHGDYYGS